MVGFRPHQTDTEACPVQLLRQNRLPTSIGWKRNRSISSGRSRRPSPIGHALFDRQDSSVLLHLAMKAFAPAKPPFPLLHVDTTWKFREMIAFRDQMAEKLGFDLLVHINRDGVAAGVNPSTAAPASTPMS